MTDMARLLLMLGLAGAAVTFLGSLAIWFLDEPRRLRRALKRVLLAEPEAMIMALGRGRGAAMSFSTGLVGVTWDRGDWCLVYKIHELTGAELIIDGQVAGRVFRGEPRRALDQMVSSAGQVTLRLVFDDARFPDFEMDLWLSADSARRDDWSPRAAIQEANRWLARVEAILRRPPPPVATPAPAPTQTPVAAPPPPREEPPPWDDADDDRQDGNDDNDDDDAGFDPDDGPPRLL
ncbi:MAG: hypothetical protein Q8L66_16360 [Caulobacter sp.]|nr:hypothetical protein [Caulobacter sp.]